MKKIYLIKALSYRVIDNILESIIKDNTNITTFSLNDVTIYDCIDDASYFGMFDEDRVIVIKDVKYFGGKFNYEEESNAIKNLFEKLDDNITIILICDNILKTKDLTKFAINNGAEIIDKSELEEKDILSIINDYASSIGVKIDEKTVKLLLKKSNNNIDIALMEIDKIANVDKIINENIVNEYSSTINGDETFDFVDAVVQKRFDIVFSLLDKLLNNNTEVLGLISLLANRYSTIYIVKSADKDGLEDESIAELLGFKNKGRLYYIRKDGKIYTIDQLKEIIINLSELDKKIKTGLSPVYGLKELLLNL